MDVVNTVVELDCGLTGYDLPRSGAVEERVGAVEGRGVVDGRRGKGEGVDDALGVVGCAAADHHGPQQVVKPRGRGEGLQGDAGCGGDNERPLGDLWGRAIDEVRAFGSDELVGPAGRAEAHTTEDVLGCKSLAAAPGVAAWGGAARGGAASLRKAAQEGGQGLAAGGHLGHEDLIQIHDGDPAEVTHGPVDV